jgi:hypothetical protein
MVGKDGRHAKTDIHMAATIMNVAALQVVVNKKKLTRMPAIPNKAQTEDSTTFSPDGYFEAWEKGTFTAPQDNDFRSFILSTFGLPVDDTYTYAAVAEVSLAQAQQYIEYGGQNGLHAWYRDDQGKPVSLRSTNNSHRT